MKLYRILSKEEWLISQKEGKVPRCKSDERDNCIHLNKYEDIVRVTNAYFEKEENPVVIEIDAEKYREKITWISPSFLKPWQQPNLDLDNIPLNEISRFCYLEFNYKSKTFEIAESF